MALGGGKRVVEPGPADHQVADHAHQLVEAGQLDPNDVSRRGGNSLGTVRHGSAERLRVDPCRDRGQGLIRVELIDRDAVRAEPLNRCRIQFPCKEELERDAGRQDFGNGVDDRPDGAKTGAHAIDVDAPFHQCGRRHEGQAPRGLLTTGWRRGPCPCDGVASWMAASISAIASADAGGG